MVIFKTWKITGSSSSGVTHRSACHAGYWLWDVAGITKQTAPMHECWLIRTNQQVSKSLRVRGMMQHPLPRQAWLDWAGLATWCTIGILLRKLTETPISWSETTKWSVQWHLWHLVMTQNRQEQSSEALWRDVSVVELRIRGICMDPLTMLVNVLFLTRNRRPTAYTYTLGESCISWNAVDFAPDHPLMIHFELRIWYTVHPWATMSHSMWKKAWRKSSVCALLMIIREHLVQRYFTSAYWIGPSLPSSSKYFHSTPTSKSNTTWTCWRQVTVQ